MKKVCLALLFVTVECLPTYAARSRKSDIPGDGVITCGPTSAFDPTCTGGVGTVSLSAGTLTGTLQQGGSEFGIDLLRANAFLTFTTTAAGANNPPNYNPAWVGPLGLNPRFQPSADHVGTVGLPTNLPPSLSYLDATVPLSGQEIRLNITNTAASVLSGVSFYLGRNLAHLSSATEPQDDGLTFGLYCSGKTHAEGTAEDCALPANWRLLTQPSGPGTLDPADLDPSGAVFGDALQFRNITLAPGQTGQFAFFLTDFSSTRVPPGGAFTPANQSFVVEIAPNFASTPEPASALLVFSGLLAIAYFGSPTLRMRRGQRRS
jgi:hypothetical protein